MQSLVVFFTMFAGVAVGAIAYGTIGFGFALVAVPLFLLFYPGAVPATVWLLTLPFAFFMIGRERHALHWRTIIELSGGRIIGLPIGISLLVLVPSAVLVPSLGAFVCAGSILAMIRPSVTLSRPTRAAAGVVSGVMGSAAALGGPALALANGGRSGPEVRSTLAACFLFGDTVSLLAVAVIGRFHWWQVQLAATLLPAMVLGYAFSSVAIRYVTPRLMRVLVTSVSLVAGLSVALGPFLEYRF